MRPEPLPFSPPSIGEDEIAEVVDVLRSDWITTGPKVKEFESQFAAFVGAPAAAAVNSGTAALHVSLCALGIGEGDTVFTTPMTFCSCVHVIEQIGATPVLVDVERDTLNMSPALLEEAAADRTADGAIAVMPVHYAGHPCHMSGILRIAAEHDMAVIEDAAHALPARTDGGAMVGDPEGSLRRTACFSFYATKNMTTGEGGMVTGTPEVVEEARAWSLHGMNRDAWGRYERPAAWYYEVDRAGFKYNMTDLQAAVGIHQLARLPSFQERRRAIVARYDEALGGNDALELPARRALVEHAWHLYVVRLNLDRLSIDRRRFIEELAARNIGASVHFIPIHLHRYYRDRYGFDPDDFPVAYGEYRRLVSLPLYPRMSDADVADVVDAVDDVTRRHRA